MNKPYIPIINEGVYSTCSNIDWYYGIVTKIIGEELEVMDLKGKYFITNVKDVTPTGRMYLREK